MRLVSLLVLLAIAPALRAQPVPGTCTLGRAEATLAVGRVEAALFNTGALFFGGSRTNGDGYLVPRATGKSPVFAASLWLGGTVGGQLRVAAARYTNYNFWPGPLGDGGVAPADCAPYDRIDTVSRADVAAYLRSGALTDDLRDWPASLGAPVLDGDGIAGNYDLAAGDQPALRGDVASWWIMNDVGGVHVGTATPALGVEVRAEAFGFDDLPLSATTFYRYTFTNRTADTIEALYAGVWVDSEVGGARDDHVGTDTTSSMAYSYNADNDDEVYGIPPAIGIQVASGPVGAPNRRDDDRDGTVDESGERLGATASMYFNSGSPAAVSDPTTGRQTYNYLLGLWADGSTKRDIGSGYAQTAGTVTPFAFAGDPVTRQRWSELNNGTATPVNAPGDRRMTVMTGPFRLGPGASETVVFAVPFAQGISNLDSVTRLRILAGGIRNLYADGGIEAVRVLPGAAPPVSDAVRLGFPSPNPFTSRAVVRYEMPTGTRLRATLHDVLGRRLAVLVDGETAAPTGEIAVDGRGLAPGVYRVRVSVPAGERIVTLVRAQ